MSTASAALLNQISDAMAAGDRLRLIPLVRKLAELLRSADGSRLRKLLELLNSENVEKIGALIKELLAMFGITLSTPAVAASAEVPVVPLTLAEANACVDEAFADESQANAIDFAAIVALIKLLMQLIAAIRGAAGTT